MEDICNFDLHTNSSGTAQAREAPRSLPPQEKASIHLRRLKTRIGLQSHVAHPRPLRDFPFVKKDFELALEATRKIELNHLSLLDKKTRCQFSTLNTVKDCSVLNSLNGSPVKAQKYPLNNPVFNTLWEKVFARKNGGIRPINKDESLNMTFEDPSQDSQRLVSRYEFSGGSKYFKDRSPTLADASSVNPLHVRNGSLDNTILSGKVTDRTLGLRSKQSSKKKDAFKLVGCFSPEIKKSEDIKVEDLDTIVDLMNGAYIKSDFRISTKRRPVSGISSVKHPQIDPQGDASLKYESPLRKRLLMRRMHERTTGQIDFVTF